MSTEETQKKFSLEIPLTIILIVIIVFALIFVQFFVVESKARDNKRIESLQKLTKALEQTYESQGSYPSTNGVFYSSEIDDKFSNNDGDWIPGLFSGIELPNDPRGGTKISPEECFGFKEAFIYKSDGRDYKLISNCAPEGTWDETHVLYDPVRPKIAWMTCSSEPACSEW